jgi:hypothetical protein
MRGREAEMIKLPSELPNAAGFRLWKIHLRTEVMAASGRGRDAFQWILRTEMAGSTMEALADSEGYESLDNKLAAALMRVTKGGLGRKLSFLAETFAREGRPLTGRQCLFVIYGNYKVDEAAGALFNLQDLISVKYLGDSQMEVFLHNWESVLCGMAEEPSEATKELLFLEQVRRSALLKEEINHYDRVEIGHVDKCYAFLHRAVTRYLDRTRRVENRASITRSLGKAHGSQPALPAGSRPAVKAGGKGGGKGKGKGKSRSPSAGGTPRQGICFPFRDTGKCARGSACPYKHERSPSPPAKGKGKGRGKKGSKSPSRGPSPSGGGPRLPKSETPCRFHGMGHCRLGSGCAFKHSGSGSSAPAPKAKAKAVALAALAAAVPCPCISSGAPKAKKARKQRFDFDPEILLHEVTGPMWRYSAKARADDYQGAQPWIPKRPRSTPLSGGSSWSGRSTRGPGPASVQDASRRPHPPSGPRSRASSAG